MLEYFCKSLRDFDPLSFFLSSIIISLCPLKKELHLIIKQVPMPVPMSAKNSQDDCLSKSGS